MEHGSDLFTSTTGGEPSSMKTARSSKTLLWKNRKPIPESDFSGTWNVEGCSSGWSAFRSAGKKAAEREAYEKSADFKQGQRFRAGIWGRI
jgi:hypothetical protein